MSKKIPIGIVIALLLISIIISSVSTVFIIINHYGDLLSELPKRASLYEKLANVDELVRSEYFGNIDNTAIDQSLASGYISGLDDDYCYFIAPDEVEIYDYMLKGIFPGIGITAHYDSETGYLKVSYVYPDSPADKTGITSNCYITSVDGRNITPDNFNYLFSIINDEFDSKVKFSYAFAESIDENIDVTLSTGYNINSCVYSIKGNVGYIRFSSFYENTVDVFKKAIEHFSANSISAVILDLRNCNGSDFDSAAKIIDMIVPIGTEGTGSIYTAKNENDEIVMQFNSDSNALNMSLAVLINSRTESAAELIACDLRDFGKAILIGETTAGEGTLQKLFFLDDGSAVSLTVAEIHPYISKTYNNIGVIPDIEIITSESFKNQLGSDDFSNDEQYNKAYSYLTGQ